MYICHCPNSAKTPATLLHCLLTNVKTEKDAYVLFKAMEKTISYRLIRYIRLGWSGIHTMLESCVVPF